MWKYLYVTNLQGDVIGITTPDGESRAVYTYDPFGKPLTATGTMASINPLRYRGYYYDTESGLYYVKSRYYDPEICRWINADGGIDEGAGFSGYNLFSYCADNPVNLFDPDGGFVISTLMVCVIVGVLVGGTVGGLVGNNYANAQGYSGWDKAKCIVAGVAVGGVFGGSIGYIAAPFVVSATGVAGVSITVAGGITLIPNQLTGQLHHVLSNPIMRALDSHPLRNAFERSQSVIQALTKNAHRGYQMWHRFIDNYMVGWLQNNYNSTEHEFWQELYKLYNTKDVIKRFGEGVLIYIREQLKK